MATYGDLDPRYVATLAQALLDHVSGILEDPEEELCNALPVMQCGPLISKLSVGPPTVECCPMVAVYVNRITPIYPQGNRTMCAIQWDLDLQVEVHVCYPVSSTPQDCDPSESDTAFMNMEWAWAAYRNTARALSLGLIPELACGNTKCCDSASIGDLVPIYPSGGCAGSGFSVVLRIP